MAIISPHEDTLIFNFGKYEGKTFEEVEKVDRKYLTWVRNSDLMSEVSNEVFEQLDFLMEKHCVPIFRHR